MVARKFSLPSSLVSSLILFSLFNFLQNFFVCPFMPQWEHSISLSLPLDLLLFCSLCWEPRVLFLPLGSVIRTSDEEEPWVFLLISSFKTLLLAESIEITPSRVEFDNDVLNVSQESGREPRRSKPWIYSSNLMPIADNWFIIPWKLFRWSVIVKPSWYFKLNICFIKNILLLLVFRAYKLSRCSQRVRACVSPEIWFNTLSSTHCLMNQQTCLCNRFHSSSILLSGFTVVNTGS